MTFRKFQVVHAVARPAEAGIKVFHLFGGRKLPASPSVTLYLEDEYMRLDSPCLTGELAAIEVGAYRVAQDEFIGMDIRANANGEHVAFAWFRPMLGKTDELTIDMGHGILFNVKTSSGFPKELIEALTMPQAFIDSTYVPSDSWEGYGSRLRSYRPQPQISETQN